MLQLFFNFISIVLYVLLNFMFCGYEMEFYVFQNLQNNKLNNIFYKTEISNDLFDSFNLFLFNKYIDFQRLNKDCINIIPDFKNNVNILKREKTYGQIEISSPVYNIKNLQDITVFQDIVKFIKKVILEFCNINNLECFFKPLPQFVKDSSVFVQNNTVFSGSSFQFNLSSFEFSSDLIVKNLINVLYESHMVSEVYNTLFPTKNCVERLKYFTNDVCPLDYKLSTPSKISWGYKDNRTVAVRLIKNHTNNNFLPNYRVEFRVCSNFINVKSVLMLLLYFDNNIDKYSLQDPTYTNSFNQDNLKNIIL